MEIIYDGPRSPSRQIADWLISRIRSGEFATDARIPSESRLVQELGVARETARRGVKLLRDEGWVYTVPARGTFVSEGRPR